MSSNCPPQLQLSIQPNTTTFKTSFEQFGFHLDSPVGGTDAGGSAADTGNERNKRARSSSSLSQSSDTSDASRNTASTLASGSGSSSESSRAESSAITNEFPVILPTARSTIDPPPRLPTPVIQDIDMAEVLPENDHESTGAPLPSPQQTEDNFRLSMARFNAFESEIALLRGSQPLSPSRTRSPTPPPTLPPLSIVSSSDQHVHQHQTTYHLPRATPPDLNFFRHLPPRSPSPFLDHFLNETESTPSIISDDVAGGEEISAGEHHDLQEGSSFQNAMYHLRTNSQPTSALRRDQNQQRPLRGADESAEDDNQVFSGFRDRLNTALQRLRPASPLVPGLEDSVDGVGNEVEEQALQEMEDEADGIEGETRNSEQDTSASSYRSTVHILPPDPPTLPPIPPIAADTDADDWHERPLIDDSMETYIPSSAPSQGELEVRARREAAMQRNVRHFLSLSSSSISGLSPPSSSSSSISGNPSLRDLPLPSPILRDLHSWMQERGPFGESSTGDASNTSTPERLAASATVSQSNATNSHADQRQPIPTGAQPSQLSTSSGGVARVNEWNAYSSFSPTSASGSSGRASAEGSSSSASVSGTAQEPTGSSSFTTMDTSSSNSDSLANTTSVSSSRNTTDEAAVRSLDHGVGVGLGFGPGSARPMPSVMSSGQSPTPSRNEASDSEQTPRNDSSTLTSTANGLGQPPIQRPITRVSSGSWPSWARESGMGPLPDLDLDFSSMAGTAGSSLSSPSMSDDWRSDAFTAAPPGDRPAAVRGSPPTTTTSISLDDSFLESTMTSLDIFPTTAAPGPGPRPVNPSNSANNFRQAWSELHASPSSSSSSSHEHQHLLLSRLRHCPHNPRCVYIPGAQSSHTGAGSSTTPNPSTSEFQRPHVEPRRRLDADRHQEQHRRWLMDSDSDSDSIPLPNRIPSNSTSLLNRLHNINRAMDSTIPNPSQYRRLSSSAVRTESNQPQPNIPHPRLRTSHSHARLGSTTSLASETASERRRLDDHAAIARARAIRALSSGSRALDAESAANAANTRSGVVDDGEVDERGLRRVQEAWDEIRAMHRQLHRNVSGDRSQNAEMNASDTRSSFDRLVQNAWQSLDNPDISLSSPEDEHSAWLARSPPTPTTTAPSAASEDVDMSFTGGADAHDAYWRTFLRELGIENPFDPGHRPSSSINQNRREGRGTDPYGLGWPDIALNNDNRSSGTASSSTSPTDEGSPFTSIRMSPYATLAERNLPTFSTRDASDANIDSQPRRYPFTNYGRIPSLPSPDLGSSFSAEQAAQTVLASGLLTSRHLSGMLNRNSNFATPGNHGIGPSHYQHQSAAPSNSIPNGNHPRHVRPPRHVPLAAAHVPPTEPAPEWESMMDTTEDNSTDNGLFASMLEDREHIAQLTARHQARIANLRRANNLAEFAPGPFRNTLQHSLDQHHASRRRVGVAPSIPPSIPPLSFEDNNLASLRNPGPSSDLRTPEEGGLSPIGIPFQTGREMPARREPIRPPRPGPPAAPDAYSHPATSRSFASARAEAHRARAQNELFLLNRQMRMEASRSGDPSTQRGSAANSSLDLGDMEPAPFRRQTIEAMRNRYRSRYGTVAENLAHANRSPVYPGPLDEEEMMRDAATFSARVRRNRIQFPHEMIIFARGGGAARRGRPLGDFMRDEDFDESYESLLSLAQTLGDVKPRSTPAEVIEKMEKAQYKDWATEDSDQRCPICLDDYNPTDPVLKLSNCSHWLHQECLQQWLQTANTCPVCRKSVSTSTGFRRSHTHTHHHRVNPFGGFARREPPAPAPGPNPGSSEGGPASNANGGNNATPSSSNPGHQRQYHHSHYHHGFPPSPWRRGPPPA
uniref:RING-type domain-containing protein n=1 Tax=Psilocybe cubensis TaxID=181762 RepID=A0A8H7XJN0_PSICU